MLNMLSVPGLARSVTYLPVDKYGLVNLKDTSWFSAQNVNTLWCSNGWHSSASAFVAQVGNSWLSSWQELEGAIRDDTALVLDLEMTEPTVWPSQRLATMCCHEVSVMHINNEIGTMQPLEEIGEICAKKQASVNQIESQLAR